MDETLLFEQWLSNLNNLDEPSFTAFADALNQDFTYSQQQTPQQVSNIKRLAEQSDLSVTTMSRPLKQQKTSNSTWDSSSSLVSASVVDTKNQVEIVRPKKEISWSSSSTTPSFFVFDNSSFENKHHTVNSCQGMTKRISSSNSADAIRPFSQAKEHILAERKRRERINERLISLSKLIPGLSKMDKATVLADAVKYIKQLQEKVKSLEEENDKIKPMQSHVVYVKRYDHSVCNNNSSSDDTSSDGSVTTNTQSLLPEIEARFCNKDVLISIHSQKKKGALERLVAEIEKLHLTVVNSSVMSFGDSALNISVVAQMDDEFNMNMNQLVKSLHAALDNLYN